MLHEQLQKHSGLKPCVLFLHAVYHRLVGGGGKMCSIVRDNVGGRLTCLKITVSDKEEKGLYTRVLKAFSLGVT